MISISNWRWIAEVAAQNWPTAGEFIAALALNGIAVDGEASAIILAAFVERQPVQIVHQLIGAN